MLKDLTVRHSKDMIGEHAMHRKRQKCTRYRIHICLHAACKLYLK